MKTMYRIGRAVLGGFFLYNGINHFRNREALKGYAAAKHVQNPSLSVQGSGVLLIAAGASLILGIKPQFGAAGALGFLSAVSPMIHDFWKSEDPQQKQAEMIQFSKNLALAGATVAILGAEGESSQRKSAA